MVRRAVKKKLYDAASNGDVTTFQDLLQQDPYLLDVVSFAYSRNLLHIATMRGQVGIVEEVLKINPQVARSLDSQKLSALHIATAEGNFEIAKKLTSIAPEMCWSRDCQGMNPIHIAAMNGHAEVLEELIRRDPFPAREKVGRGQTAMHLCVKHCQLRTLQVLVHNLGELVRVEDDDGETVLHLAVRYKQVGIVRYLVDSNRVKGQYMNSKGKTALEISKESDGDTISSEITKILVKVAISNASIKYLFRTPNEVVMVVMILITTMAFQAIINPPGGVWQDDSPTHNAGEAIMASNYPDIYERFVYNNTIAFISSFTTMILLACQPSSSRNSSLSAAILLGMSFSMAGFYDNYRISIIALTPATVTDFPSLFWEPATLPYLLIWGTLTFWDYVPKLISLIEKSVGVLIRSWNDDQEGGIHSSAITISS